VAFVWLPFEHDGLDFAVLHEEPRVVALEAGHPLAAERVLRMEQLVDEPWPWADADPVALAFWTCADYRGGAAARRGPTIRSMEGMLEGVRAGLCVATVPRSQARVSELPGSPSVRSLTSRPRRWRSAGARPMRRLWCGPWSRSLGGSRPRATSAIHPNRPTGPHPMTVSGSGSLISRPTTDNLTEERR
jgi:DNA-binding transcriptional LysR family regulator